MKCLVRVHKNVSVIFSIIMPHVINPIRNIGGRNTDKVFGWSHCNHFRDEFFVVTIRLLPRPRLHICNDKSIIFRGMITLSNKCPIRSKLPKLLHNTVIILAWHPKMIAISALSTYGCREDSISNSSALSPLLTLIVMYSSRKACALSLEHAMFLISGKIRNKRLIITFLRWIFFMSQSSKYSRLRILWWMGLLNAVNSKLMVLPLLVTFSGRRLESIRTLRRTGLGNFKGWYKSWPRGSHQCAFFCTFTYALIFLYQFKRRRTWNGQRWHLLHTQRE